MSRYPPLDIALTSVFVGSKAEETYKKIREILAAAFLILNPDFQGAEVDIKAQLHIISLITNNLLRRLSRSIGRGLLSMRINFWRLSSTILP